jgi:hypothetical protein
MVEVASETMLRGENPYRRRYDQPPVSRSQDSNLAGWRALGYRYNPGFDHLTYPPGVLYLSAPVHWLALRTLGFYDQRFVYLALALALAIVLASFVPAGPARRMMVVGTLANPLLGPHLINGRNDVIVLLPLAVFAGLLLRERWRGAAIALGVAIAMKQFALFVVPFFLLATLVHAKRDVRAWARVTWPVAVIPLLLFVPWLIADAPTFVDNVFVWVLRSGYPVRWDGFGLSALAYGLGQVDRPSGPHPYGYLVWPIMIGGLALLGHWVWRRPTAVRVIMAAGALLYLSLFMARSFSTSYLAAPVMLWGIAWIGSGVHERLRADPRPPAEASGAEGASG